MLILMSAALFLGEINNTLDRQLLEAEHSLAKSSRLYFVLDIREKKIDLKAKGISLRTWKIEKIRLWGDPVLLNPALLVKKSALFSPKREEIKPEEPGSDAKFELEALELGDMPSSYTINLERNISIYIRPRSKGWMSFLRTIGRTLKWRLFPPLKTVLSAAQRKSYTAFDILLENREESRSFYWAVGENSQFIILRL
ncbi:MAG: hypothetical protein MUP98_12965 [Candidatus Aminicenantes bacterium]|nr:hypothetical protein [Candidatus Aminicenantes bacterium]